MEKEIIFSAWFSGASNGFAEFRIYHFGELTTTFVLNGTGENTLSLEKGLYLVSVKGLATLDGATINISENTSPATPDNFEAGPIYCNYVLNLT